MRSGLLLLLILCFRQAPAQTPTDPAKLVGLTDAGRSIMMLPFYRDVLPSMDTVAVFRLAYEMEHLADNANDDGLKWEAQWVRVLCRMHHRQDSTIFLFLNDMLEQRAPNWFRASVANLLGNYCMNALSEYELGLSHLMRASDLAALESERDFPYRQKFHYHIATRLCDLSDFETALMYLHRALDAEVPRMKGFDYRVHVLNAMGFCYRKLALPDSSDHYFKLAYHMAQQLGDLDWEGIAAGNIGENLYMRGALDDAIPYLRKDVARSAGLQD
jgi:tetratricopeptide (TPR) repeat protein